jgi:hypothetical protein
MADIFISYARKDREAAERLAASLKEHGYQVWWDTELVGSDDFRDVILEELTRAKAVIVIWSENSVRSKFVRDEASRADNANKLITTCLPGFDTKTLPLGFGGRHVHPAGELEMTLKALARIGVLREEEKPAEEKQRIEEEARAWEEIKTSQNREDFENYIRAYTDSLYRAAAAVNLRKIDLLNNETVRAAGRVGYRGLQVYAWILVFSLIMVVLAAPFAQPGGKDPPVGILFGVIVISGYLTYRLYRWFYSGARNQKNASRQRQG